jgi:site-specific recombinase XerD
MPATIKTKSPRIPTIGVARGPGDQSWIPDHAPATASSAAAAAVYVEASRAEATHRGYRRDLARFAAWCGGHEVACLPAAPETVALYLAHRAQAGAKPATVARALAAIADAHRAAGLPSPREATAVRAVMSGIRRTHGTAPRQAQPLSVAQLRAMLPDGHSRAELRDRALLLLGFAGAFRRSELVALDVADLELDPEGFRVRLRRGKTDQEGHGEIKGIPYGQHAETCPVRAVQAWIAAAGIREGALFRRVQLGGAVGGRLAGHAVAEVIKRRATAAGLDATHLSGHSLRAGFATAAARRGKSEHEIMRQTGHRSAAVLRGYIRRVSIWDSNAAEGIGL